MNVTTNQEVVESAKSARAYLDRLVDEYGVHVIHRTDAVFLEEIQKQIDDYPEGVFALFNTGHEDTLKPYIFSTHTLKKLARVIKHAGFHKVAGSRRLFF